MYHAPVGAVSAGALGAGTAPMLGWANAGWLALAVFVLVMAIVALYTIVPRRRKDVAKVNPPEAR